MTKIDQLQQSMAAIFYLANRLQTQGDQIHPQITMRQWMLLLTTAHLHDKASYTTVAASMGCTKQNVKQLASVLFKKGYLQQAPHPTDHRAIYLSVTSEGRRIMQEYYSFRETLLSPLAQLYTEAELDELLTLLRRFITYDQPSWCGLEEKLAFLTAPLSQDLED